ncbi:MAG: NADH-plastoquinone oxidoreductase subunit [Firmicutes bacterium ADurb.Bin182]|nr:MAG: NADH-plastoquinone oxidoreductase subunit [Firmicutes bacterium ADurb.Bin182]
MKTRVFYFSGTGNTFALTKKIAEKTGSDLISIPKVMNSEKIHIDAENMIIVFPSYMAAVSGVPLIVERFVRKIDNINELIIFAVCNCGGYPSVNALPSLHKLHRIIKYCGGKLYAHYSLRLPMNNLDYDHIPIPINKNSEDIIRKSKMKTERICCSIINKKKSGYRLLKSLFFFMMKPVYKLISRAVIKELKAKAHEPMDREMTYHELVPLTDKSIIVDENCTGCGICAKVCPAGNIKIVNKKPEFLHRCEICFACDEWCPTASIHHWSRASGVKYHHPEISLADMIKEQCDHI